MRSTTQMFTQMHVRLFALLFIMTCSMHRSNAQCNNNAGTTTIPQLITYNVCDLAESFTDTLYYYSEFDVESDGTREHMKVYDYVLPYDLTGKLKLQVKGGKGGDSKINCGEELYGDGGNGALVTGWATVGTGGIPRGSIIRYVLGEAGQDSYSTATGADYHRGGSGGGASAILYKAPDSTNWTVLMIAGGGGGGYAVCFSWDDHGTASLFRLKRTGGPGGLSQSELGDGGAKFYVWRDGNDLMYVNCGGFLFTAPEFSGQGIITTNDAQNFCSKISGGGGFNTAGQGPCGECSGGMRGSLWTQPSLPNVYTATFGGDSCVNYSNMRKGGRGFCGGGAAWSASTWYFGSRHDFWPGTGGGGGATGGAGAIGSENGLGNVGTKPAEGGTSWVNQQYITSFSFVGNNTIENGYGNFYFIRDTAVIQPDLAINIGEPMPICTGTNVHMVATLSAAAGSVLTGIIDPVFTWRINGQTIGTGTNVAYNIFTNQVENPAVYTFNTINITYHPGDLVTCSVAGIDLEACGRAISRAASFLVPADNGKAVSQVQAIASTGNMLCLAYHDVKSYGLASLQATAALIANIGNSVQVSYHPSYRWYLNGERMSVHYSFADTLASIPSIFVADGDSVWCEVFSDHCSIPNKSNVIHFTVSGVASTGGTITGAVHPGPNTTVTYSLTGALHAVSYSWTVTGDVSNIVTSNSSTVVFHIGTGNAHIVCHPQGACGGGDTLQFDVSPSNHIPNCQNSSPLLVTPDTHCAGTSVTISAPYDTAANHNNFDWYEWSTGANTRSITVTADGSYYAYLNGCKSETVVVTALAIVQPSIGISFIPNSSDAVRNYWCRQDGYRFFRVTSSTNLSAFSNVEYQWFKNGIRVFDGVEIYSPDRLDMNLNTSFYNTNDTITCKAICTAACGTVTIWSNDIILPEIREPAVVGITIIPSATTVCSGQAINFTSAVQNGGPDPNYKWFVDFDSPVFGISTYSISFTNFTGSPQTHTVYAQVFVNPGGSVGCLSGLPFVSSDVINITVKPQSTVSVTADNAVGCAGTPITLSGSPAGGIFDKPSPYLGPSSTYKYYYVDANGCTVASAPAIITVNNLPLVSATVSPNDTICANGQLIFSGSGANTYSWTKGVIDGESYPVHTTDTFTVTGYGAAGCGSERVFIKLSAGYLHSFGIKSDGTLWAWGTNTIAGLGDGTTASHSTPVQIGTDNNWVDISTGVSHSMAIKSDGTLWSWGENDAGQLGIGTYVLAVLSPVQVGTATNWTSIAAGGFFSLGVQSDGSLWSWGANYYGALGVNANVQFNSPMRVDAADNWTRVVAGEAHSVALKSDGSLWTWGAFYSALNLQNYYVPHRVGGESDWISIGAGGSTTMAIKSNGTLWAWGDNDYGQVGDGTTTSPYAPMQVGTGTNWVSVTGGIFHSLGLQKDGTLWAWGRNSEGQLGIGGLTASVLSPTQIGNETNWATMAAGFYHSVAIKSYGASLAWGGNGSFQLGDGTSITRAAPVTTVIPPSTATIIIHVKPSEPITVIASPSSEICSGDAVTLTATGSNNLTWTSGITNGIAFVPVVTDTLVVTGTAANGCTSTAQHIITVNTMQTWYLDADHDGHYTTSIVNCGWPGEGYVLSAAMAGDCNDSDSTKWQSALLYVDMDGDGYTVGSASLVCYGSTIPTGYASISLGTDCNDTNAAIHPGAIEICDGLDNNCDGTIDEGLPAIIFLNSTGNPITSAALTCSPTTVNVTATGGVSYSWDGGATPHTAANSFNAPGTYTVTVTAAGGCIAQAHIIITANTGIPAAPGPLDGFVNVCRYVNTGTQLIYSVHAIPGATFAWIVPATTTLVSGQGTNSIVLLINTGFVDAPNKQIRVTATSSCGTGPMAVFYLRAQIPGVPLPITGTSTNVCPVIGTGNTYTFTIASVAGASSYLWATQDATTVVNHPNGFAEADTTITVSFTNSFSTSAITVSSVNACGVSNPRSLTVFKTVPAMPGLVAGPTNVCAFTAPNGVFATYSVNNTAGNTYNWTTPLNVTGLTGQGTNSISFLYPPGFTTGAISVSTTSGCGTGPARTLLLNRLNAAIPGPIDVIALSNCPERLYSYTIATMPANTVLLQWTVPAGAILHSGQGTTSITVAYPTNSINGVVTVQAINNCSNSTIRSLQVKLPVCAPERSQTIFASNLIDPQPGMK